MKAVNAGAHLIASLARLDRLLIAAAKKSVESRSCFLSQLVAASCVRNEDCARMSSCSTVSFTTRASLTMVTISELFLQTSACQLSHITDPSTADMVMGLRCCNNQLAMQAHHGMAAHAPAQCQEDVIAANAKSFQQAFPSLTKEMGASHVKGRLQGAACE